MERVWKYMCHNRFDLSGLDFVHRQDDPHPPKRGPFFSRSMGYKDVCFQRLWIDLDKSRRNPGHFYHVLRLLFSAPAGPLKHGFFERVLPALKSFPRAKRISDYSKRYCDRLLPERVESCVKDVLSLMAKLGWRPSHFTYSPIVGYVTDSRRLLSQVEFVNSTSEQIREKWFEVLLSNPIPTLNLSVQYDEFPKVEGFVEKCLERKKLKEVILHLNDGILPISRICGLTCKLLQTRNLCLLEITSIHQPLFTDKTSNDMDALSSPLTGFLKEPNFLCLRLYNVVDISTAKLLVLTFLSTPCVSEQCLELGGLTPDGGSSCMPTEQTLPSTNKHWGFKSLVLDSIRIINNETLEMDTNLKIEDVFVCNKRRDSLSAWLFGLERLMVGDLLIKVVVPITWFFWKKSW